MKFLTKFFMVFVLAFCAMQVVSAVEVKDVCSTIPPECDEGGGQVNAECICKIWCAVGCGGSACNCDLLPSDDKTAVTNKGKGLVNPGACKERIDAILKKEKKILN